MNYFRIGFISVFVFCAASTLWADKSSDTPLKDSIFFNVGGSLNAINTQGVNFGVGFGFGLSALTQFVLDANLDNFPTINGQQTQRTITLLPNIRFRFLAKDNPVVPYLIGGIGVAYGEQDALTYGGSVTYPATSSVNAVTRLGLGMDIRLDELTALYLEDNENILLGGYGNWSYNSLRLGGKLNL